MKTDKKHLKDALLFAKKNGYNISLEEIERYCDEISLLDEFAMMAMNGLCANSRLAYSPENVVEKSYEIAEKILKRRK